MKNLFLRQGGENTTALLGPSDGAEGRFVEEWLEACDVAAPPFLSTLIDRA